MHCSVPARDTVLSLCGARVTRRLAFLPHLVRRELIELLPLHLEEHGFTLAQALHHALNLQRTGSEGPFPRIQLLPALTYKEEPRQ